MVDLIVLLILLTLGYSVGSWIEKSHYKEIKTRATNSACTYSNFWC